MTFIVNKKNALQQFYDNVIIMVGTAITFLYP